MVDRMRDECNFGIPAKHVGFVICGCIVPFLATPKVYRLQFLVDRVFHSKLPTPRWMYFCLLTHKFLFSPTCAEVVPCNYSFVVVCIQVCHTLHRSPRPPSNASHTSTWFREGVVVAVFWMLWTMWRIPFGLGNGPMPLYNARSSAYNLGKSSSVSFGPPIVTLHRLSYLYYVLWMSWSSLSHHG